MTRFDETRQLSSKESDFFLIPSGPHYCRMDREERQAILQSQYRFTCDCTACHGGGLEQRRFGVSAC